MHYTCITRPSVEIKTGFSRCLMENDVKVNIICMLFRTLCFIEFEAPCSRNLNGSRSKIVFLESPIHILSMDALLVHQ
jgi:hypothetical protein